MSIDRSTPALGGLYQEVILEHFKHPRNKGDLSDATHEAHLNNPVCGDEIHLQLRVAGGRIEEVGFTGQGCSISQASVSMLTDLLKDRSVDEALALGDRFTAMMHGDAEAATDRSLGNLRALAGVSRFPVRIKCALLGWNALEDAVEPGRGAGRREAARRER